MDRRLPLHLFIFAKLDWQAFGHSVAIASGSSKLRPLFSGKDRELEAKKDGANTEEHGAELARPSGVRTEEKSLTKTARV